MTLPSLRTLVGLGVIGAAAWFTLSDEWPFRRLDSVATTRPIVVTFPFHVVTDTLHPGENLATVLGRQGVTGLNLQTLAAALSFDPRKIRSGLVFSVHRDGITDEATQIEFRPSPEQRLQFIRTSTGWTGRAVPIQWRVDTARIAAGITSSLYEAFDRETSDAKLDRIERLKLVNALAEIHEWSIDFSRDIQTGDQFAAVYERLISEEGDVRLSRVLASSLTNNGKEFTAFHHVSPEGRDVYYDTDGRALRRAFLMAPLEFKAVVTSNFSSARFHPILGRMRKHEGTDYAAPRGTRVRATADGVVTFAGTQGGYGRMVEIRHRNGITTRYAHLNSISIRAGARVSQNEGIGTVGATGLATAPHLHYEFRVNGVAKDPRSIRTESGEPLRGTELSSFQASRNMLRGLLYRPGAAPTTSLAD